MRISRRSASVSASDATVLVTGAAGFLGRSLAELLSRGGAGKLVPVDRLAGTKAAGLPCLRCDLADYAQVKKMLRSAAPSRIYHLAGVFAGGYEENYNGNFLPAKHILDAVLETGLKCRVLLVGSAAEYGEPEKNPVPETAPLRPVSFYGFTKVMQTRLGEFYARAYGADVVIARPFNLTGPGVSEKLFPGRVQSQIERYLDGKVNKIRVGRLDASRDYISADEAASALALVMDKGRTGETYNIGSGRPMRISAFLKKLLSAKGVPFSAVEPASVEVNNTRGVPVVYADVRKLHALRRSAARAA